MADKKIRRTPDFVEGLMKSADEIDKLLTSSEMSPRYLLTKLDGDINLENLLPEQRQALGIYQAG